MNASRIVITVAEEVIIILRMAAFSLLRGLHQAPHCMPDTMVSRGFIGASTPPIFHW